MNFSDLSPLEQKLSRQIHQLWEQSPAQYLGAVAILCQVSGQDDFSSFAEQYTRGDCKRAIKNLRKMQRYAPQYEEANESAIACIRRELLARKERGRTP